MEKPDAPACWRNREPILGVLRDHFADRRHVLEIGSGTGQHAVFFAEALRGLTWQCSDRAQNLPGISMWLDEAALPNTPPPLELDVAADWPETLPGAPFDALFTANTLHIMSWAEVERLFEMLRAVLTPDGRAVIYGPFNRAGRHTSEGNAAFDAKLRAGAPHMGLRDVESVEALARAGGFSLIEDRVMPANNLCLTFGAAASAR